jgi:hypothetical protein
MANGMKERWLDLFLMHLTIFIMVFLIFIASLWLIPLPHADYRSETKAFDVGGGLRCDFYIEYIGSQIVNISRTAYCISLNSSDAVHG